ncbi:malonate decarboxylase holo-[acyl-carrier-protein] synthase [Variovorax sp. J22R133]|uniref:malonate decarboxylase holo-[acyl-carrier-protein] synthase n=1 Tax=Variovorax brevis TaxID=3053503 RepID=UPI002575B3A3|nr:malonate decarboxylase holo-[acyl-carrier-protein] synthase [Variovorax sp. J22R133]MDM0111805.1 malonate decarboxylase holo-[acyl-carrier-protein] synthase [Variovorax sp. J22R133]
MESLRRHRLVRVTSEGWAAVLDRPWDAQARECLTHWATHRLPLVITRQPVGANDRIAVGLPAPGRWDRRRLALQVPRTAVECFEEFPALDQVMALLPPSARSSARELQDALAARQSTARVFGSYGWQAISGLDHLRASSDLDVCVAVSDAKHADAVALSLSRFIAPPRLDGELMFADGTAVAWREWLDWRAERSRFVMLKGLTGASLRQDAQWCEAVAA